MKISDVHSAKGLKLRLDIKDIDPKLAVDGLIKLERTEGSRIFMATPFGDVFQRQGKKTNKPSSFRVSVSEQTADYINELLESEQYGNLAIIFAIEGIEEEHIEIQTYTFRTITEYKTPIEIQVQDNLLGEKRTLQNLESWFVWRDLGLPGVFVLNYKNSKKHKAALRFISRNNYLLADNTPKGIVANRFDYIREKYDLPVDLYLAPEVRFVRESDTTDSISDFSRDIEKITEAST